jgi:signal peptidase I
MEPTLRRGDQILVDKLAYGWSVPFGDRRLVRFAAPTRGDVATFRTPEDDDTYIKRVVGVPGDRIELSDRRLSLNGKVLPLSLVPAGPQSLGFPPGDDRELYNEGEGGESRLLFYSHPAHRPGTAPIEPDDACTSDGSTLRCTIPDVVRFRATADLALNHPNCPAFPTGYSKSSLKIVNGTVATKLAWKSSEPNQVAVSRSGE